MRHPFELTSAELENLELDSGVEKLELDSGELLTDEEISQVSGGGGCTPPPTVTTFALGEEGGC